MWIALQRIINYWELDGKQSKWYVTFSQSEQVNCVERTIWDSLDRSMEPFFDHIDELFGVWKICQMCKDSTKIDLVELRRTIVIPQMNQQNYFSHILLPQ